ncbi:MAG: hypothetical protein QXM31_02115 [Candidatus Woesearchaeota archaeon]
MAVDDMVLRITLAVIVGTLAAIVYSIRVLILMERRVARIEEHIDNIAHKILIEEQIIEKSMRRKR